MRICSTVLVLGILLTAPTQAYKPKHQKKSPGGNSDSELLRLLGRYVSEVKKEKSSVQRRYSDLPPACSGQHLQILNRGQGVIEPPLDDDGNYRDSLECRWDIHGGGNEIVIELTRIDMGDEWLYCFGDCLEIATGKLDKGNTNDLTNEEEIAYFYDDSEPLPWRFVTHEDVVSIIFDSNWFWSGKGFTIKYEVIETPATDASCDFEGGQTCTWSTSSDEKWSVLKGKNSPWSDYGILTEDHTTDSANGHFLYFYNDGLQPGAFASIQSAEFSPTPEGRCMRLWYNMPHTDGALVLTMITKDQTAIIWQRNGIQGMEWFEATVSLMSNEKFTLELKCVRGNGPNDVGCAIDDITVQTGSCGGIEVQCEAKNPGANEVSRSSMHERISGGTLAQQSQFPYIAHLQVYDTPNIMEATDLFQCGASLINSQWLLTAAHCFEKNGTLGDIDVRTLRVKFGELDLSAHEESQFSIEPIKVVPHPNRNAQSDTVDAAAFDFALIKLPHDIFLSKQVKPVCLPDKTTSFPPKTECIVSGWGVTEEGMTSEQLLYLQKTLLSTKECSDAITHLAYTMAEMTGQGVDMEDMERIEIPESIICAKSENGISDACQGDSGGPMICRTSRDNWVLAGVVSFGMPCGSGEQTIGFYGNVESVLSWIETTINEE